MGYNSYSRQRARTTTTQPASTDTFSEIAQAINKVEKVGTAVSSVATYVKPSNRSYIGLAGLAAIAYWIYTAKK